MECAIFYLKRARFLVAHWLEPLFQRLRLSLIKMQHYKKHMKFATSTFLVKRLVMFGCVIVLIVSSNQGSGFTDSEVDQLNECEKRLNEIDPSKLGWTDDLGDQLPCILSSIRSLKNYIVELRTIARPPTKLLLRGKEISNLGSEWGIPQYQIDSSGVIHLSGVAAKVSEAEIFAILPAEALPERQLIFNLQAYENLPARVDIDVDGNLKLIALMPTSKARWDPTLADKSWISLNGISFPKKKEH